MTIAQIVARERTGLDVIEPRAGPAALFVAAIVKGPVARQLGTTGATSKVMLDIAPGRSAMWSAMP